MIVLIPSPLHSYTQGASRVGCEAASLGELLDALDARFPGIRFRMIDEQDLGDDEVGGGPTDDDGDGRTASVRTFTSSPTGRN